MHRPRTMSLARATAALVTAAPTASAAPAVTASLPTSSTVPVACDPLVGEGDTVLAWDDVTYELSGTCGVVRVTGDRVTVVMPTARRLVVEGSDVAVRSKPLATLEVSGARAAVTATSVQHLALAGTASSVAVTGLFEDATVTGPGSVVTAARVHTLRLESTAADVRAAMVFDLVVAGDDNRATTRRADEVVVTGARNAVSVARGRTTVRDRGVDNTVQVHRRR